MQSAYSCPLVITDESAKQAMARNGGLTARLPVLPFRTAKLAPWR